MSFVEAVQAGWRGYVDFAGRASRSAYWWWVLFVLLVGIVAGLLDVLLGTPGTGPQVINGMEVRGTGLIAGLASLVLLLPGLAVSFRRLHDTDRSAWWILINFIPIIGWLVYLVFMLQRGTAGPNRFGPAPIETAAGSFAPRLA